MTSELSTSEAATPTSPPEATPSDPRRGNLTLAAVLLAVLVVPMSISGTAVALPAISSDIGGGASGQQWVVNAFNLSFACFTLVWGSLSDRFGRGRLFAAGAATFTVGSVASTLAPNIVVLDVARGVAGLGGAAIFSCGAAILSSAFDGPARLRAFALFGTTAGIGVALGPTLSGLLVDTAGWRPIFAVQAAVLLVVLAATPAIGLGRPAGDAAAKFDLLGTVLLVLGLLAAMVGIVQGEPWGWGSPAVVASFVLAVALLVAFARVESRRPAPLLDLELLTHARFMALCLVPVAASFGFVTLLTYFPTFLQFVAGQSSAKAGLVIVLLTIPVVVGPLAAGRAVGAGVNPLVVIWISLGALIAGDLGTSAGGPRHGGRGHRGAAAPCGLRNGTVRRSRRRSGARPRPRGEGGYGCGSGEHDATGQRGHRGRGVRGAAHRSRHPQGRGSAGRRRRRGQCGGRHRQGRER
ncbi:MFS transporter [Rhodococcus sp. WB9]|uniref:MFS transporter n=1 Tax=Rhodococcus sp. WB9 TaxID=2594007 RepID=UPI0021B22DD0|nr:MFS transporter [Rhodococcus sp. WB9]